MDIVSRKIDKLGRIVLPMDFRKALGLEGEVEVILGITEDSITIKGINTCCRICGSKEQVAKNVCICARCINKIKEDKI